MFRRVLKVPVGVLDPLIEDSVSFNSQQWRSGRLVEGKLMLMILVSCKASNAMRKYVVSNELTSMPQKYSE